MNCVPAIVNTHTWQPSPYADMAAYLSGEPLLLGIGTVLLAHLAFVEDRRDVVRVVTAPERLSQPVLYPEHPWEHQAVFYPSLLPSVETGRLRMWYGSLPPLQRGGSIPPYRLLYAESDDGFHWDKPLFDLYPDSDCARTNILYRGANNNCSAFRVVYDPRDQDVTRRYKMLHKGGVAPNGAFGEEMALSPDGMHWRPYEGNPVMPMRHDCNMNLLYHPVRGIWTAFCRPYAFSTGRWLPGMHPRRRIAIAESPDLIQWSKVRTVIGPEEGDANEFDSIAVFPHGAQLVGLLGIFAENPDDLYTQVIHIELAFSLDGMHWERAPRCAHWLSPTGRDGDFDGEAISPVTAAIIDPDTGDWLMYYNGTARGTDLELVGPTAIGMLRIQHDRFVEQHAGPDGGWLLTREFLLEGTALSVNCRVAGTLRAELARYPGEPLPGFSIDDSDIITGDHLAHRLTWRNGQADLSALRGTPIYLRFHLQDAGIWSLTIEA